jgi:hypothetical protein
MSYLPAADTQKEAHHIRLLLLLKLLDVLEGTHCDGCVCCWGVSTDGLRGKGGRERNGDGPGREDGEEGYCLRKWIETWVSSRSWHRTTEDESIEYGRNRRPGQDLDK